jgi:hypothetical protein
MEYRGVEYRVRSTLTPEVRLAGEEKSGTFTDRESDAARAKFIDELIEQGR